MKSDPDKFKKQAHRPLVVALVIFVVGTTFILDLPEYVSGVQSGGWDSQMGTLEARDVRVVDVGSSKALELTLKYRYVVNNRLYFGNRLKFQQDKLFDGVQISRLEKKYKNGDQVKVFYDPTDPAKSCLEPGAEITLLVSHLVIYILFALIIYLSAYPRLEKVKSAKTKELKVKSAT